ncbi:MAG: type II toxin-antitoxin system ParD family antitoxin [Bryobacterales bacterium]|nr:type II toxin-antitoxin system ParD family antitoxin [Bryobacterales bacterium]
MPNVQLTEPMEAYVRGQIRSGAYANPSEVVRAGIRLLMERDGSRQFYALKADLEQAVREAESGAFSDFDPLAYEPDAFES